MRPLLRNKFKFVTPIIALFALLFQLPATSHAESEAPMTKEELETYASNIEATNKVWRENLEKYGKTQAAIDHSIRDFKKLSFVKSVTYGRRGDSIGVRFRSGEGFTILLPPPGAL